jgi:hypothetical protein
MMLTLAFQYSSLVFIAVVGVLQAAAGRNNLRGLLFFKRTGSAYIFAILTTIPVLAAFFRWNYGNATGVIEGSQQAGLFALSTFIALIFTLVLSSLIKHRYGIVPSLEKKGLNVLVTTNYFRALRTKYSSKR